MSFFMNRKKRIEWLKKMGFIPESSVDLPQPITVTSPPVEEIQPDTMQAGSSQAGANAVEYYYNMAIERAAEALLAEVEGKLN